MNKIKLVNQMSARNELIIFKENNEFYVHLNSCVDNEFVPKRNTLLEKFDSLESAIKYANEYCNEEMIEYSYHIHPSCLKSKNKTLKDMEYHFGLESPFAYGFNTIDVEKSIEEIEKELWRLFNLNSEDQSESAINRRGELLALKKFILNEVGDLT